jgi:hypothetical protein
VACGFLVTGGAMTGPSSGVSVPVAGSAGSPLGDRPVPGAASTLGRGSPLGTVSAESGLAPPAAPGDASSTSSRPAGVRASTPVAMAMAMTAATASAGTTRRHRFDRGPVFRAACAACRSSGRAARVTVVGAPAVTSSSSSSKAVGRRSGSLSRVRAIRSLSGAGRPSSRGGRVRMAPAVAAALSPPNGVRPVPAYVTTTPHANTSAAGPIRLESVSNRSGAM